MLELISVKEKILEVTLTLFAEKVSIGTNVEQIANIVGIKEYYHYKHYRKKMIS